MHLNKQYLKYFLGFILYISFCRICLISLKNYAGLNESRLKNNTLRKKCNTVNGKPTEEIFQKEKKAPLSLTITELEYNAVREEFIDKQSVMHLRLISEVCNGKNLSSDLVKRHFLYNEKKNGSLYCWIRKVASTSFTKLFSDSKKRSVTQDYYKEIDILAPKTDEDLESLIEDDDVFKFVIVRHPFERIVSSYRDRIEDNSKYTAQAWIYAPKIFHLTRPELFLANMKDGNSLKRIFDNNRRLKLVPTFREFITWLLQVETSKDDVHWDSYHSHCSVCDVNYNFVMKLEDYSFGEIDFILSKIGFDKNQAYMPRLEETKGGFTDYERTCRYLKTLSQDMVVRLYQRYKIDFQMFDYRPENYLTCAES